MPASLTFRTVTAARVRAYRAGFLSHKTLPGPSVAVGNLTVGGSGKTPIAAWIAGYYCARGLTPGILLRGYGGDEGQVHRNLVPDAIVMEDPDRPRGAARAFELGARVFVLDDAFQRLDVSRDLNVAVVSAESGGSVPWTIPSGPWREGWCALERADLLIITRKRAGTAIADQVARRAMHVLRHESVAVAHLGIKGFRGMFSDKRIDTGVMRNARIVAAAGVGDPDSFAAQCRAMGADVTPVFWEDHHAFSKRDIARIVDLGTSADHVVITEKDAAKLRRQWPRHRLEPLVADLGLEWESGGDLVVEALDAVVTPLAPVVGSRLP